MADTTEYVEFIQHHFPPLLDGEYKVAINQDVTIANDSEVKSFSAERTFVVQGERFSVKPQDIHAVFPPAGNLGEYSNVLPHIIFNRSTLPWEREPQTNLIESDDDRSGLPWLALLLFEDSQKPTPQIITLEELLDSESDGKKFPDLQLEYGQSNDDKVTVIDVVKSLLVGDSSGNAGILPALTDLEWLGHIRQMTDGQGNSLGDEYAGIIGNRLPLSGGSNTVHLVSLEGLYDDDGFIYNSENDDQLIRFVSLKNWSFSCLDEEQSFSGLLNNLDRGVVADISYTGQGTLRMPYNSEVETYLKKGNVPLGHYFRKGSKSVSWFHGPLVPAENTDEIELPINAADQLMRYNSVDGIFDVSYAAAWELGRALALKSRAFSISLYNWKRSYAQQQKQLEQQVLYDYLPGVSASPTVEIPDTVKNWFKKINYLEGIPFSYLVSDERLLPKESIRFFYLDQLWMECLLDGAFSIGRVISSDSEDDSMNGSSPTYPHEVVTGFLIRSDVVSGWPSLLVDGYDGVFSDDENSVDPNELALLRMDRLSANVLLCLFEGEVQTVDIHLKPETLHFGLDVDETDATKFIKKLRDSDGNETSEQINNIPWVLDDSSTRTLDIASLAMAIAGNANLNWPAAFTSAQFALEMIEGVEKVRFVKTQTGTTTTV